MSARVIFFASIRDSLGLDSVDVNVPDQCRVSQLIDHLAQQHGAEWRDALTAENTRVAVNQELVTDDAEIVDGDEVAFFPPVTGG